MRSLLVFLVLLTGCGLNELGSAELAPRGGADGGNGSPDDAASPSGPLPERPPDVILDGGVLPEEADAAPPAPAAVQCTKDEPYCASKLACVESCSEDCGGASRRCVSCGPSGTQPATGLCTSFYGCYASNCPCAGAEDCVQRGEVCVAGKCVACGVSGSLDKSCNGGGTCARCGFYVFCHDTDKC